MNVEIVKIDGTVPCYKIDGVLFEKYALLAFASKISSSNKKDALNIIKMAEGMYAKYRDETFDELCNCVQDFIIYKDIQKDELYYQEIFKNNCKKILGENYEIYDKKNLLRKRPDAWVIYENSEIPVEMKLRDFNYASLEQLLGYISMYGCKNGIAIGERLTTELPKNIKFVELKKIKKLDNY